MPRWLVAVLFVLLVTLWWVGHRRSSPTAFGSGGTAMVCPTAPMFSNPDEPLQSDVAGRMSPFRMDSATISPLAGFSLQARVLSRENYHMGREADYSPTDLALGWGPMSASGLADRLHVSQDGRWYRYEWGNEGPPLAPDLIRRDSANMHMVPADRGVADALEHVRTGDIVRLNGWLIRIDDDRGWHWQSSLSREDTGSGACELVLVCSIETR